MTMGNQNAVQKRRVTAVGYLFLLSFPGEQSETGESIHQRNSDPEFFARWIPGMRFAPPEDDS